MNRKLGFTLVELLVTITIMVILITLSVANIRGAQMTARDDQRTSDVRVIAQQLETYYQTGSDSQSSGQYPPTDLMSTEADIQASLRDIEASALRAPNVQDSDPISFVISTDTDPLTPTPTYSTYVYQPLQSDNQVCVSIGDECRKFNIYYMLESEPNVVKKISSKNQ
jgi:prepilin-type N-terminal cleavage/methylation domain-containing protein